MSKEDNNKIEELSKRLSDVRKERVGTMIESIHDEIDKSTDVYQVPEDVFRAVFAPYFKLRLEQDGVDNTRLQQWFCISGGPYKEVDIVSSSGDIVDRVPSYYIKPNTEEVIPGHMDIENVIKKYERLNTGLKSRAEQYIFNEFSNTMVGATTPSEYMEHKKKWEYILDKYAIPNETVSMTKEEKKEKLKSVPKDVIDKLDLNYDE